MTLVDTVLEMLRACFPGFEPDGERARRPRSERPDHPQTDPVLARCYAELGIPCDADFEQVRRAWRRLMREHHPDVQGEDPDRQRASTELAQRLNNAFGEIRRRRLSGGGF